MAQKDNLAAIAVKLFTKAAKDTAIDIPATFSGIMGDIAIGVWWGRNTTIYDIKNGDVFTVYRTCFGEVSVYRATDLMRRFKEGEDVTTHPGPLWEFLFRDGSKEAALGSNRADVRKAATLSPEETKALLGRLRAQGIEPEDYLA